MIRRAGWGLADQGLSSLTNFAVGILIARTFRPDEFGAFGLAFATYAVGLNVARAFATQPLVVRYSHLDPATWRRGAAAAAGVSVVVGAVGGLLCIAVGLAAGGALRDALIALGVTMPGLLLQDSWRFAFFAGGRDRSAFLNDLTWAILLAPALASALLAGTGSIGWPVLAWGIAAGLAGLTGIVQSGLRPAPRATRAWWREHRDLAPRYLGEFMTTIAAAQVSIYALGLISGLAAVGALRAGQLLLGPLNILIQGIGLIAVPEAVRILRISPQRFNRLVLGVAGLLAGAALAWGAVIMVMPGWLGTAVLGRSWEPASGLILPLALGLATTGVTSGAYVALRALAAARRSLRASTIGSVLAVIGGVGGAGVGAAAGVAWGQAAAGAAGAAIWWAEVRAGSREHGEMYAAPARPVGEGTSRGDR